jgi:hypothetical protein
MLQGGIAILALFALHLSGEYLTESSNEVLNFPKGKMRVRRFSPAKKICASMPLCSS